MARQLRFQYPDAVYHVMARGDGGKQLFLGKEDHESFLHWLGQVCGSLGWRVHAWVLMGNHFHLLLETPEANLSAGMWVLLGTFSQAWNSRHQRRGHVFQGRYKAVPVAGERAADAHYFKTVADYIHLNPARAKLPGGGRGRLAAYPWSSLRHYAKGDAPPWQETDRVLDAFRLGFRHAGSPPSKTARMARRVSASAKEPSGLWPQPLGGRNHSPPNFPEIVLPFSAWKRRLRLEMMAYHLTTPTPGKSAMRPKNRVWGFSRDGCNLSLENRLRCPEPRRKSRPTPTIFTPGIPQWPSRDPLAEYSDQHGGVRAELGTKLYGFVGNSPLNQVDPFGLVEMPDDLDSSNLSWDEIKKQLPGVPCKNPRSKGECCSKARAYFFANPANRGSPSGASVCCDGRLVACNWGENVSLDGYDGPNERLEDFIKKLVGECIVEHELVHVERTENYAKKYPNVACPCDCGILLSRTPTEETDGQECAAHGLSVKCFRKAKKKCAELSDKKEAWICADIMSLKEDNSKKYRNHHCQKVLDSLPPIRVPIYK